MDQTHVVENINYLVWKNFKHKHHGGQLLMVMNRIKDIVWTEQYFFEKFMMTDAMFHVLYA